MRLSAVPLINFSSVNGFDTANEWTIRSGEPNTLYFQLVDLDKDGLRYIAGIGSANQPASIAVTFPSIDSAKVLNLNATVANAADGSIWQVAIPSNQSPFSGNVWFAITEGTVTRRFNVLNMISVEYPTNDGSDGTLPNSYKF